MKIEKIQFKNLTSYEGEHEIDFTKEPLRSADLFAICGDTGSGKSTLLDAVCLALYNNAPRLDGVERLDSSLVNNSNENPQGLQPNDARNFLRRGKDNAYARVAFEMPDGTRYEAEWSCRLTRNKTYDKVAQSFTQLSPKKQQFKGTAKEIREQIVKVVGLTFDQFCRTVLLAQNSFASFLKADKADKSELLEKLTGTEIYGEVSRKIYQHYAEANKALATLQSRIEGLQNDLLNPQDLEERKTELQFENTRLKSVLSQKDKLIKEQLWLSAFEKAKQEVTEQKAAYEKAQQEMSKNTDLQKQIDRYDQVLDIQPIYETIELRKVDIERYNKEKEELEKNKQTAQTKEKEAYEQFTRSQEKYKAVLEEWKQRQADFNKGHQLEGEISQTLDLLKSQDLDLEKAQKVEQDYIEEWTKCVNTHKAKETELNDNKQKLQHLQVGSRMYEQIEVLNYKFSDFKKTKDIQKELEKKHQEAQKAEQDYEISLNKISNQYNELEGKLKSAESLLELEKQNISGKDGVQLQNKAATFRERKADLSAALELWKRLFSHFEEQKELSASISRNTTNLDQLGKDKQTAEQNYQTAKEAYDVINNNYIGAKSKDLIRLRQDLREGNPCPLCGATHHPYHTETEIENGQLIENLEKEWKEKKEELEVFKQKKEEIELLFVKKELKLNAEKERLEKIDKALEEEVESWNKYAELDSSLKDCSSNTDGERRITTIKLLIDNAKKEYDETQKELDFFNIHQKEVEKYTNIIYELQKKGETLKTNYNISENNKQTKKQEIDNIQEQIDKTKRNNKELYNDLDSIITIENWLREWEKSPEEFVKKINDNSKDWKSINQKIDTLERLIDTLGLDVKNAENHKKKALEDVNEARDKQSKTKHLLEDKNESLRKLFGDSKVGIEEEKLQNRINVSQEEEKLKNKAYHDIKNELHLLEGRLNSLLTNIEKTQKELSAKNNELDIWIAKFNMVNPPLQREELASLLMNKNWNAIRQTLDNCKQQVQLCSQRLNDAQNRYNTLYGEGIIYGDINQITTEHLALQKEELEKEAEVLNTNIATINRLIQNHEKCIENTQKEQEKLKRLQEDAQEWGKLNDIFGSADGKKFRELAQRYTFYFLVEHANAQLALFSPRYRLSTIPKSLVLKVTDRDMFDKEHYVSSLSGGETFVVSLALALGLASLSSSGLSIGSLFIDEGFGNLDNESLEIVMQALSNLQSSQGRKVGVISHTSQIREQISPQIRVEKIPGEAKSKINIV